MLHNKTVLANDKVTPHHREFDLSPSLGDLPVNFTSADSFIGFKD